MSNRETPKRLLAEKRLSRRTFLWLGGLVSGLGLAAYAVATAGVSRFFQLPSYPTFDQKAPTGRLSAVEMESILALLEILIPMRLWTTQQAMVDMVNHATETAPGTLKEYKAAVSLLDQAAREHGASVRFAQADAEVRQRIIESFMWKYAGGKPESLSDYVSKIFRGLERLSQSVPQRRFRVLVAQDLMKRFYSGPIAWNMAGYSRYPGVPGDPREYVHPLKAK